MRADNIIFLVVGGVVGFAAGALTTKKKYQKIADEEIASVVEEFRGKKKAEKAKQAQEKADSYVTAANDISEDIKRAPVSKSANIEIIPPEEFGTYINEEGIPYDYAEYHYFADGVLTNDENDVCKDVDGTIGLRSLTHFGDYEPARVFVRNHDLELDCEIIKDPRRFADVKKQEATYDY